MYPKRGFILPVLSLLCLSAACAQVLDIQDAHIDSTLSAGFGGSGGASAAAESGTGGMGAALGESGAQDPGNSGGRSAGGGGGPTELMAGADTSSAGSPEAPSACESYCAAVIGNCTGKYEQYRTLNQCLEVCKQLPSGTLGDENVNSVECRTRQAYFAESEPLVYCKSAGPLGAGKCGSNCESYCSLMQLTCTRDSTAGNVERSYFTSTQDCLADCTGLPADPSGPTQYSSSVTSVPSTYVGNNVYCRTYHLTAALEQDAPTEHCPHAIGGDPCNPQ